MATSTTKANLPDVYLLRRFAKDQLVLQLEFFPGQKDLVLDKELMKPLDRISGASVLKEHGVDKIFKLESGSQNIQGSNQRIYMIRPDMLLVKYIADHINSDRSVGNDQCKYHIMFVPRKLHTCELILEQEGVYGFVSITEFQLDFIPLDRDIISLEYPNFFRSFYMNGDQTWCHTVAKGLLGLQQICGLIPNVYVHGRASKMVHELLELMYEDQGQPKQLHNEVGNLIILDREVDYVTPLCSQVTYEGLLDDSFGISCGLIEFDEQVTGREQVTKLLLTSESTLFEDIRNRHFSNVFNFLGAKAKELQTGYDSRHDMKSVKQLKSFVSDQLGDLKQQHKSLTLHIGACEVIMKKKTKGDFEEQLRTEHTLLEGSDTKDNINYIEELLNRQVDMKSALRLLCLLSLTQDGLQTNTYKFLKTQFLQAYGYEHLVTWHNLKKAGLLIEQETVATTSKQLGKMAAIANLPPRSHFRTIVKKLALVPKSSEDVNLKNPNDMSYVFSGAYAPMLCKLVEQILQREGFSKLEDILKTGPYYVRRRAQSVRAGSTGDSSKVTVVCFVGGCTYTEIAALRFLAKQKGHKILIATTAILNSSSLIKMSLDAL